MGLAARGDAAATLPIFPEFVDFDPRAGSFVNRAHFEARLSAFARHPGRRGP